MVMDMRGLRMSKVIQIFINVGCVNPITIMSTEKDIKTHVYENVKDLYDKTKY